MEVCTPGGNASGIEGKDHFLVRSMCLRIMSLYATLVLAPSTTNSDAVHVPPEPVSPTAPTSSASGAFILSVIVFYEIAYRLYICFAAPYDPGGADEASGAAKDADSDEDDGEDEYHSVLVENAPVALLLPTTGALSSGHPMKTKMQLTSKLHMMMRLLPTTNQKVCTNLCCNLHCTYAYYLDCILYATTSSLVSSDSCDDLKHVDDDDNPDDVGDLDSGEEPEQDNIVVGAVPEEDSEYEVVTRSKPKSKKRTKTEFAQRACGAAFC
ncbi:hypothetical protein GQ600_10029 [Phytophthora cactorum]|nr:hypothetical protein GQ600_10029 [Phytophthora cactorum]